MRSVPSTARQNSASGVARSGPPGPGEDPVRHQRRHVAAIPIALPAISASTSAVTARGAGERSQLRHIRPGRNHGSAPWAAPAGRGHPPSRVGLDVVRVAATNGSGRLVTHGLMYSATWLDHVVQDRRAARGQDEPPRPAPSRPPKPHRRRGRRTRSDADGIGVPSRYRQRQKASRLSSWFSPRRAHRLADPHEPNLVHPAQDSHRPVRRSTPPRSPAVQPPGRPVFQAGWRLLISSSPLVQPPVITPPHLLSCGSTLLMAPSQSQPFRF